MQALEEQSNFAGVLATLSTAKARLEDATPDDLPDDTATLSYENALRAQSRYKAQSDASDNEMLESHLVSHSDTSRAMTEEQNRKSASITIRLSQAECLQLRQRAAEAGLTISAYLRSCTFEVEVLRAQVKQALAELRTAHPVPAAHAQRRWWQGLLPAGPRSARA